MKKYLIPTSTILLIIVLIAVSVWKNRPEQVPTNAPGIQMAETSISDLYIIDGELYYITHGGQFTNYANNNAIHTFPNHAVEYSRDTGKLVFADGEKLCTYDMQNKTVETIAENGAEYVSYADSQYVFYRRDNADYMWDIAKQEESQPDDYTKKIYHLETEYLDGKYKKNIKDKVLAFEYIGDEALVVTSKNTENKSSTAIGKVDKNGNFTQLTNYTEHEYVFDYLCRLVTDGNIYAYAIAGQNEIVTGKIK